MRELRPPEIQVKASSASFAPVLLIVEMLSHWVTGSLHTHTHSLRSFKDMNIVELKATALCVLQTYPWASPDPSGALPLLVGRSKALETESTPNGCPMRPSSRTRYGPGVSMRPLFFGSDLSFPT